MTAVAVYISATALPSSVRSGDGISPLAASRLDLSSTPRLYCVRSNDSSMELCDVSNAVSANIPPARLRRDESFRGCFPGEAPPLLVREKGDGGRLVSKVVNKSSPLM